MSPEKPKRSWALLIASAACVAVAAGFFIFQTMYGNPTYVADYPWGVYIAAFFAFVACGAGVFIVGGVMRALGALESDEFRRLSLVAFGCFLAASLFVTADSGVPWQIPMLATSTNFGAPILIDFWVILICLAVSAVGSFRAQTGKAFALVAVAAGFIVLAVEAWLVLASVAQELLSVTMGANAATFQALICGFAIVMLVIDTRSKTVGKILAALLGVFLITSLIDVIAGMGSVGRLGQMWAQLASSPLFWIGLAVGVVFPAVVAFRGSQRTPLVAAAICVPLGVFFLKLAYLWASQGVPVQSFFAASPVEVGAIEAVVTIGAAFVPVLVYQLFNKQFQLDAKGRE